MEKFASIGDLYMLEVFRGQECMNLIVVFYFYFFCCAIVRTCFLNILILCS